MLKRFRVLVVMVVGGKMHEWWRRNLNVTEGGRGEGDVRICLHQFRFSICVVDCLLERFD